MRLLMTISMLAFLGHAQEFDVVIRNGRIMDPASGVDSVRQLGIRDGKIAAISEQALQGRSVIDASGLVVAPALETAP